MKNLIFFVILIKKYPLFCNIYAEISLGLSIVRNLFFGLGLAQVGFVFLMIIGFVISVFSCDNDGVLLLFLAPTLEELSICNSN